MLFPMNNLILIFFYILVSLSRLNTDDYYEKESGICSLLYEWEKSGVDPDSDPDFVNQNKYFYILFSYCTVTNLPFS